MSNKLIKLVLGKKLAAVISAVLIIVGLYLAYQGLSKNGDVPRYVTAAAAEGTLIVSVSGSGQVSASDQVDIQPKVSGEVVYVGVKSGQEVKEGDLLVRIDSRDAQKTVKDAQTSLETAKLELEKLLEPEDDYSLMQAENALIQARDTLTKLKFTQETKYQDALDAVQKTEDNLEKGYEDVFNTVANSFLDLPTLMTGLRDILYSYEISETEISCSNNWNISCLTNALVDDEEQYEFKKFIERARDDYRTAREKYDENFEDYKDASRYSDKETIESLLEETLETTKAVAEVVKSETNMLDYWTDHRSRHDLPVYDKVSDYQSELKSYTSKTNSHLSSLLSAQRTIKDNIESKLNAERDLKEMEQNNPLDLAAAERSIKEKEESLARLKEGADELDIRAKKIAVQQKEEALLDAQQSLADHYVRAPFDGIVASIDVKEGESVSAGAIATLITDQRIAEITLNEIDIAQVRIGQRANITFDAVEDLNITGEVVEVDTLGTATQGVVNYGLKIAFDTQDERVKPGMSLSAAVIIESKQNALLVPNSAVKQQGDTVYVQVADGMSAEEANSAAANISGLAIAASSLRTQQVKVGLSNDTMTEIIDGLAQGDVVITQTVSSNSSQSQSSSGGGQVQGQMFRMMR